MKNKKRIIAVVALTLLVVMLAVALTACGPLSVDAAMKKMEKKGYACTAEKNDDGTAGFVAVKDGGRVFAYMYNSSSDAKKATEKYNSSLAGKVLSGEQVGKWLVFGNEQGIKDFK